MGIDLKPVNGLIKEQHLCYAEWNIIHAFLRKEGGQLFTQQELARAYFSDGLRVSEWKAIELSRMLVALELVTKDGIGLLDRFQQFCWQSGGFKIV